jgi:hypothetical protein
MKSTLSMLLLALGLATPAAVRAVPPLLSPKAAANQIRVVRGANVNHLAVKTPPGTPHTRALQARPSRTVVPLAGAFPGANPWPATTSSGGGSLRFPTPARSSAPLVLTNETGQQLTLPALPSGMAVSPAGSKLPAVIQAIR